MAAVFSPGCAPRWRDDGLSLFHVSLLVLMASGVVMWERRSWRLAAAAVWVSPAGGVADGISLAGLRRPFQTRCSIARRWPMSLMASQHDLAATCGEWRRCCGAGSRTIWYSPLCLLARWVSGGAREWRARRRRPVGKAPRDLTAPASRCGACLAIILASLFHSPAFRGAGRRGLRPRYFLRRFLFCDPGLSPQRCGAALSRLLDFDLDHYLT